MTNRRTFLTRFAMAAGAVSLLKPLDLFAGLGISKETASKSTLTLLHTANLKGQLAELEWGDKLNGLGGLVNIAKKIAAIKKESASVLAIDTGNITASRSSEKATRLFYEKVSEAGYDIVIPGPTDLEKGIEHFEKVALESGLPTIPHNSQSFNSGVLPYSVLKKGKIRIGIINAGTAILKGLHRTKPNQIADLLNTTAYRLKTDEGCHVVICLVQENEAVCIKLACLTCDIDVVVNSAEKSSVFNTQIIRNAANEEVILSYAGAKGVMLNRIDLTFNDQQEKIFFASRVCLIGAPEEEFTALIKQYKLL